MKWIAAALAAGFLGFLFWMGQPPPPPKSIRPVESIGLQGVDVRVLAQFEGVTVYRIVSNCCRDVFVAVVDGKVRTTWSEQYGKTTRTHDSDTVMK